MCWLHQHDAERFSFGRCEFYSILSTRTTGNLGEGPWSHKLLCAHLTQNSCKPLPCTNMMLNSLHLYKKCLSEMEPHNYNFNCFKTMQNKNLKYKVDCSSLLSSTEKHFLHLVANICMQPFPQGRWILCQLDFLVAHQLDATSQRKPHTTSRRKYYNNLLKGYLSVIDISLWWASWLYWTEQFGSSEPEKGNQAYLVSSD